MTRGLIEHLPARLDLHTPPVLILIALLSSTDANSSSLHISTITKLDKGSLGNITLNLLIIRVVVLAYWCRGASRPLFSGLGLETRGVWVLSVKLYTVNIAVLSN